MYFCPSQNVVVLQDDMASVSGRSIGVGSEVGELADIAADDSLQQASGMLAANVHPMHPVFIPMTHKRTFCISLRWLYEVINCLSRLHLISKKIVIIQRNLFITI